MMITTQFKEKKGFSNFVMIKKTAVQYLYDICVSITAMNINRKNHILKKIMKNFKLNLTFSKLNLTILN